MTLYTIIAIIFLLSHFSLGEVSYLMPVWATHLGCHVGEESQRNDNLVR
jgi:hypothetical protein